jgi:hypothetical protein
MEVSDSLQGTEEGLVVEAWEFRQQQLLKLKIF